MMWSQVMGEVSSALVGMIGVIFLGLASIFLFKEEVYLLEYSFLSFKGMLIKGVLLIDWMSLSFMGVVLVISSAVLFYSIFYMEGDNTFVRFLYLVLLFVFSMLLVIVSLNFVSILLGWDGLGLVSYCLVIYYQNSKSFNAGMVTVLSNRIGDVMLLISIGLMMNMGEWNFYMIMCEDKNWLVWVAGCVFVAGLTSSAQMPFSAWLPAAMAAPTPVSALVHSSTLVTAGVYLLVRFYEVLKVYGDLMVVLLLVSLLTCLMSSLGAFYEFDLKKIVALSTLSQLGLMMSSVAMGGVNLAFFHLLTHAMFKALLFLCAGSIIHEVGGGQDIRRLGGLISVAPLSLLCFNIANLALCGFPFLAGFYSKDFILEFGLNSNLSLLLSVMLIMATIFTCIYSVRLSLFLVGWVYLGGVTHAMGDEEFGYTTPMIILLLGAVFSGAGLGWFLLGEMNPLLLEMKNKILPSVLVILGFSLGWGMSIMGFSGLVSGFLLSFLGGMWFMPYISTQMVIKWPLEQGAGLVALGDLSWGEMLGGQGLNYLVSSMGVKIQMSQENTISAFILVTMVWLIGFLVFL